MADPESIPNIAKSRAPFSTWLGVVLLFSLFGVMVLAIVGPSPRGNTYEQKRAQARLEKLKPVHDEEKTLTSYAWIDKNKGSVRIPIERAMELTVPELAQKKPMVAGPITTPAPAASAPPPAGAATPGPTSTAAPSGTPKPTSVSGPDSAAHGQPAAAVNPPGTKPGTQPGANASPAASPTGPTQKSATPTPAAPGSPLPARGKETPTPGPH
jgi:hypothetical protein